MAKKARRILKRKKQDETPPALGAEAPAPDAEQHPTDVLWNDTAEESSAIDSAQIALFAEPLDSMLARIGCGSKNFDIVVIGDGSGSWWNLEGGWACVLVEMKTGRRKLLSGSFSETTIADLEIFPIIQALLWYRDIGGYEESHNSRYSLRVLAVTDNKHIVDQSVGKKGVGRAGPWWAALADIQRRMKFQLEWKWIPRDTIGLNALCDLISRDNRLRHHKLFVDYRTMIYAFNPDPRMLNRASETAKDSFD